MRAVMAFQRPNTNALAMVITWILCVSQIMRYTPLPRVEAYGNSWCAWKPRAAPLRMDTSRHAARSSAQCSTAVYASPYHSIQSVRGREWKNPPPVGPGSPRVAKCRTKHDANTSAWCAACHHLVGNTGSGPVNRSGRSRSSSAKSFSTASALPAGPSAGAAVAPALDRDDRRAAVVASPPLPPPFPMPAGTNSAAGAFTLGESTPAATPKAGRLRRDDDPEARTSERAVRARRQRRGKPRPRPRATRCARDAPRISVAAPAECE
mmetsp:Transcript_14962/g.63156  ORF Transcript_14962/g.63156 Transcript_14962/m.63156 type:complete len:265 (-) Transcript_14962:66-860(-)